MKTKIKNYSVSNAPTLRVLGLFSVSLFLLIMLLSAFVIVPKINDLLAYQHSLDTQAELSLEAALFTNYVNAQQTIIQDLAAYPSMTSAVMLSDASHRAIHELLDNAVIGGKKSRLVLQDIAGNILIKTNNELLGNYNHNQLWLAEILDKTIPYHFQLLNQVGSLLTFKISVPVIYNSYVEGVLSSEITTSLKELFVSQGFKNVAFKLTQDTVIISTGTESITTPYEKSLQLKAPNILFTYITDNAQIDAEKKVLQNTILSVLLFSLALSFFLFALIGYRSLLRQRGLQKTQVIFWKAYTFPITVGILGVAASVAAFMISSNLKHAAIEKEFIFASKQKVKVILKNIDSHLQVLDSVKAFYNASTNVSRQEFTTFVAPTLMAYRNIQAIEWLPKVSYAERNIYEQQANKEGLDRFLIVEKNINGEFIPVNVRDSYFPVYYVEPMKGNEKLLGFDLASNAKQVADFDKALIHGDKIATAPLALVKSLKTQVSISFFSPIYQQKKTAINSSQQSSLRGFVLLILNVDELFLEVSNDEKKRLPLYIEDITEPEKIEKIYGEQLNNSRFSRSEIITFAARSWRITTYNHSVNYAQMLSVWLVLIVGLIMSGIVTLGIAYLIQRRETVERLVDIRTSELQASEEQHRAVVENAVDGLLTIDESGTIEKFNQAAQRIFGYSAAEVIGVNIKILMPEPYHGEHDGYLKNYRDTGVKKIIGIGRYVQGKRKDGTIFPIDLSVSEMNFGDVRKFSGIVRDVSERVALEKERDSYTEQLIASEEQHRAVVENAVDGLLTIDESGTIEKFNPAAQRIFGYSAAEVIGVNIKILMPEPYHGEHDGYLKNYRDTGVKKIIGIGRYVQGKRKDGTTFPMDLSVSEMNFGDVRKFSGIVRDVSERVALEVEREKFIDKLTDSNEELARFAFVCSHDLQEPLRMVRSFSEKLQEHIADDLENDEKGKKYFNFVIDGAARAQTLITDILAYSSISSDTQILEAVNVEDIITVIRSNVFDFNEDKIGEITYDSLPILQGNKTQILQLFQNLINNGLKYQNKGNIPHVHISVEDAGEHWTFIIKDNGIGMEERHLKKIFDVFQRLHRRSQYAGTGVGLSICKKVAERHGGTIWVESEKGIGSTFYVKLLKPDIIEKL